MPLLRDNDHGDVIDVRAVTVGHLHLVEFIRHHRVAFTVSAADLKAALLKLDQADTVLIGLLP